MATQDINTKLPEHIRAAMALDEVIKASDAAYALKNLGDLVRLANDDHAGYEGIESRHWCAVGIAMEHLGESLYSGELSKTLEGAFDADNKAREAHHERSN